jgi:hypothetical protein
MFGDCALFLAPITSVLSVRMNKNTLIFAGMLWFVGESVMAHLVYAQDAQSNVESIMSARTPVSADLPLPESAAPRGMLHHWPHVASLSRDEKNLTELLAEHPELQTHSHMTYYDSSLHVGERARLQPPGSEFAH